MFEVAFVTICSLVTIADVKDGNKLAVALAVVDMPAEELINGGCC